MTKIKMPEPLVRYADDSYKAYSRSQVESLLKQLGYDIVLNEEEVCFEIVRKPLELPKVMKNDERAGAYNMAIQHCINKLNDQGYEVKQ